MDSVNQLMSGYAAYIDAADFGASATSEAPATTPTTSVTASSPECVAFTLSAASGVLTSVSITNSAGC